MCILKLNLNKVGGDDVITTWLNVDGNEVSTWRADCITMFGKISYEPAMSTGRAL